GRGDSLLPGTGPDGAPAPAGSEGLSQRHRGDAAPGAQVATAAGGQMPSPLQRLPGLPMTTAIASPYLQRAAQRDAAGNHDEAINELARGVRAGDLPSTRALGLRLLTGSAAPLLPPQGLQLLSEAVQHGDAEA